MMFFFPQMFQSLIGRLLTVRIIALLLRYQKSFNPLQVGYSPERLILEIEGSYEFQSLIGRLLTLPGVVHTCILHPFQSLIGRLLTGVKARNLQAVVPGFNPLQVGYSRERILCSLSLLWKFQSLIGRLLTGRSASASVNVPEVSIPYRQATHSRQYITCLHVPAFQSLIGRLLT